MPKEIGYNRQAALEYAKTWAFKRNPRYLNFDTIGGDCTNYASQCIHAGSGVMNYTPVLGWYYNSSYDRSPSWTGVQYLYNFLVGNKGVGLMLKLAMKQELNRGILCNWATSADFTTAL